MLLIFFIPSFPLAILANNNIGYTWCKNYTPNILSSRCITDSGLDLREFLVGVNYRYAPTYIPPAEALLRNIWEGLFVSRLNKKILTYEKTYYLVPNKNTIFLSIKTKEHGYTNVAQWCTDRNRRRKRGSACASTKSLGKFNRYRDALCGRSAAPWSALNSEPGSIIYEKRKVLHPLLAFVSHISIYLLSISS